jgi:ATP-binding cassette subfamily B protein
VKNSSENNPLTSVAIRTTISRLLFRFYDPVKGAVALGGTDIKTVTQTSVRGVIGVVPQDTVMFNDTILHNLMYGRMNATMEEVEAAAQAAQIKTFIESLPEKYVARA